MPTLRPYEQQNVIANLDATPLGRYSFDVSFPSSPLLVIQFKGRPGFQFKVSEVGSSPSLLQLRGNTEPHLLVSMAPAEYATEGSVRCETFLQVVAQIGPWAKRIDQDLRAQPPDLDDIRKFHEQLDALLKEQDLSERDRFTPEEATQIAEKLHELEAKLQELQQKQQITEAQLRTLQETLSGAEQDLRTMPKAAWYRTAGAKIWGTMKAAANTSEGRQLLLSLAKKALLDE